MEYEKEKLPYDYEGLEPYIDKETMDIHYNKHHTGYVNKLNAAVKGYDVFEGRPIQDILSNLDQVPEEIRLAVINNSGGHANHTQYWKILGPNGGGDPVGKLKAAIEKKFGSVKHFKDEFSKIAKSHFGSGWAWLYYKDGELGVYSTSNQDSPLSERRIPLLGLDLWEHAYYLKYQNKRAEYVENFWHIVNWEEV